MKLPEIPQHWTPEEALAVYEFIDAIREAIWQRYQLQLIEQMREERITIFNEEDDGAEF